MSTTLSKGYVQPAKGEKITWWQQLNNNILRLNNHVHNGVDSQVLPLAALARTVQPVLAAGWVASGGVVGYKQTISMPTEVSFDTTNILVRRTSDGNPVYPTINKLTASTFDIYVNDNTLNLTIVYA